MATLAALGALAAGCAQPRTQIVVRLDSDYSPIAGELSSIEVVVRSQDAQERARYSFSVGTSEATAIRGFPVELFAIEPLGGDATRVTSVEVSPVQGQRLFTVRASASFQRGRTTVLTVYLARACAAQTTPCPSGQTCGRDGACTSVDRGPLPELDASIATVDAAADAQPATCVLQCCRGRTVGPLLAPSEEACRSLYPTCADYGFVRSTTFNGAVVYARDERCWAKCTNRMAFHEVTATMSSCATEAARYCATNADRGPLQRSEWNACEPFAL
jgi:hypothetical protein